MSSGYIFLNKTCRLKVLVFFVNLKKFHRVIRFLKNTVKVYIFMNIIVFYKFFVL